MGGTFSNKLQVLEMTEENGWSWSCKAELPADRWSAASVVHEGRIWVMGGTMGPALERACSVIIYDAEANTWATGPPLPSPCRYCKAATIDGGILLNGVANGVAFHYKNGVWGEVAGVNMFGATCGSVLLG
jgi:hypothetical protein